MDRGSGCLGLLWVGWASPDSQAAVWIGRRLCLPVACGDGTECRRLSRVRWKGFAGPGSAWVRLVLAPGFHDGRDTRRGAFPWLSAIDFDTRNRVLAGRNPSFVVVWRGTSAKCRRERPGHHRGDGARAVLLPIVAAERLAMVGDRISCCLGLGAILFLWHAAKRPCHAGSFVHDPHEGGRAHERRRRGAGGESARATGAGNWAVCVSLGGEACRAIPSRLGWPGSSCTSPSDAVVTRR